MVHRRRRGRGQGEEIGVADVILADLLDEESAVEPEGADLTVAGRALTPRAMLPSARYGSMELPLTRMANSACGSVVA